MIKVRIPILGILFIIAAFIVGAVYAGLKDTDYVIMEGKVNEFNVSLPTETPTPTATPTQMPTLPPENTQVPTLIQVTSTEESPTHTLPPPEPTVTETPTNTPVVDTPTPETVVPTDTPVPTEIIEPTATEEMAPTPENTDTPTPEPEPEEPLPTEIIDATAYPAP